MGSYSLAKEGDGSDCGRGQSVREFWKSWKVYVGHAVLITAGTVGDNVMRIVEIEGIVREGRRYSRLPRLFSPWEESPRTQELRLALRECRGSRKSLTTVIYTSCGETATVACGFRAEVERDRMRGVEALEPEAGQQNNSAPQTLGWRWEPRLELEEVGEYRDMIVVRPATLWRCEAEIATTANFVWYEMREARNPLMMTWISETNVHDAVPRADTEDTRDSEVRFAAPDNGPGKDVLGRDSLFSSHFVCFLFLHRKVI